MSPVGGLAIARGYFGIGIENCKTGMNLGTLWRSAWNFGASFIFVIGRRYRKQSTDTPQAWKHVPLYEYGDFDEFYGNLPKDCQLVGVEYPDEKARALASFCHPERAVYLLGAEDSGLTRKAKDKCRHLVYIPTKVSINVSSAGSIIMYDRQSKGNGYGQERTGLGQGREEHAAGLPLREPKAPAAKLPSWRFSMAREATTPSSSPTSSRRSISPISACGA